MKPAEPIPVKLFISVLYCEGNLLKPAHEPLEKQFGMIDYKSSEFKFDFSSYYEAEMGSLIFRLFFHLRSQLIQASSPKLKFNPIKSKKI